jgi:hypothetical protein
MTLTTAVFAIIGALILLGGYLIVLGVKGGFVDRRVKVRRRIVEGEQAVRTGIVWVMYGVLMWGGAFAMWWAWKNGRVTW